MASPLRVGTFSPSVLVRLARDAGALARHQLSVREVPVPSSPAQFRALLAGELDAALTSPDNVLVYRFAGDYNTTYTRAEWFDRNTMYRAIFDLIAMRPSDVAIIDYKTGKMRDYDGGPSGLGQLHLSATIALNLWPNIPEVSTTYAYVDHKQTVVKKFNQEDGLRMRKHFEEEHARVNADDKFKPTVNEFCKWCPATRDMCPYSRKL